MKVEGTHDLPFPRAAVWDGLMDPALLSRTLPGCEKLEPTGENAFRGVLKVQVGPVRGLFQGSLELADLDPPSGYRMRLKGQGPAGFMDGEGTLRLADAAGGTRLAYDLDFQVGGRVAAVGQRVLDSSARAVAKQGLEGLERELKARLRREAAPAPGGGSAAAPPDDEPEADSAPSQADFARRVALDVARDLLTPAVRVGLAASAALVVGGLLGWWLRGLRRR